MQQKILLGIEESGQIFRVDNSVMEIKVQVIITDIQSYLPAMNYMLCILIKKKILFGIGMNQLLH